MRTNPEKMVREGCLMFELRADVRNRNLFFLVSDRVIIISLVV